MYFLYIRGEVTAAAGLVCLANRRGGCSPLTLDHCE